MPLAVRLAVLFLPFILLPDRVTAQDVNKAAEEIKAHYTKYEYRIPMRDGKRLFTAVYVPKDQSQTYPILLTRTPYSVKPYGADQYKRRPRPVAAVRQGGLHLRLPGRARPLDVRGRVRQHAAAQPREEGPSDIDESTDTYDTIDWLLKNVPQQQRQGRPVGHLLSRLLHRGRHDRRPSGAQGRLAAGAGHRLVHRRRLAPQRRPVPAAHVQLHGPFRQAAARADQEVRRRPSTTTRPTATTSS